MAISDGGAGKRRAGFTASQLKSCDLGGEDDSAHRPSEPETAADIRNQRNFDRNVKDAREGEARVTESFLRGRLPRTYAWVRTPSGRAERVTILFDSGASHCFMHPSIQKALGLTADRSAGPSKLLTSNEQEVPCEGEVGNIQVMAGKYRHRMDFIVADIGRDDIILGGEVLEMQEAGYGPAGSGTYRLVANGVEYLIPLIGASDGVKRSEVKTVKGTKKILKLFRQHSTHMFMGEIRRSETQQTVSQHETAARSEQSTATVVSDEVLRRQEEGAQSYKEGRTGEKAQAADAAEISTAADSHQECSQSGKDSASETSGSRSALHKKRRRRWHRTQQLILQMQKEQAALQERSDKVKEELVAEFPDVFQEPESLPPLRWENHRMELLPDSKLPVPRGLPRMSAAELEETSRWLKEMLAKGWIRPSLAPYASRFFFVPKPNGKGLRGVCDFRAINAITKKVLPSLPLFENVVTQLDGAQFFSAVDLTSMFYQIRVEPSDVEHTAFRTAVGCYEYLVTPMGTTPSVGTAMNCMQQLLQHCISLPGETAPSNPRQKPPIPPQEGFPTDEGWKELEYHSALGSYCTLFIDDILIYSKTFEDHVRQLRQLCMTLRQHKMFLNPAKCNICQVEVEYLGNLIGRAGVRPTAQKTQALEQWPTPQNVTELKSS